MGKFESQRIDCNERVRELLTQSDSRCLSPEELDFIRNSYTGMGGLTLKHWDAGQFFTPPSIAKFIVEFLNIQGADVWEPACGGGSFLNYLPSTCNIVAYELMQEAAKVASLLFPRARVQQGNTLEISAGLVDCFDFVLGNPPFLVLPKYLPTPYLQTTGYEKNIVWRFIELGMRALRLGGFLAFVVPEGILNNSSHQVYRDWLGKIAYLRAVISLPTEAFVHSGTNVKTSILVLQKPLLPIPENPNYIIFFGDCKNIGWDSRKNDTKKNDLPAILASWRKFDVAWNIDKLSAYVIEDAEGELSVAPAIPASQPLTTIIPFEIPESRKEAAPAFAGVSEQLGFGF